MHKTGAWRALTATLVLADLLLTLSGLALAAWLASQPIFGARGTPGWTFILLVLPFFSLIYLAVGLYDPQNLLGGTREYGAVFRGATYGLLAMVLFSFVTRRIVSREWIVLSWAFALTLVGCGRFLIRRAAYQLRRRGLFTANTLIVGADARSVAVAQQLSQRGSGARIVGFLDDYVPTGSIIGAGHRVLGSASSLMEIAARTHADEAIVVPEALPWETLQTVLSTAGAAPNGVLVHMPAGFYDLLTTRVGLSERNHVPLLTVKKARLTPLEAIFKATLDYGLATVILIACSPLLALTAVWLWLTDHGVVLERQPVSGRYGMRFNVLTFAAQGPARVVFVRKLPGLLNVLRGELSIVGPRPVDPASETARPLTIKPGLTGSWRQVDDPDEQAVLDLYYIRSYSIWLDLQVLFKRLKARIPDVTTIGYATLKRAIDLVGASVLLILVSPLVVLSLLAVVVDSGRPLIYRRRVVGRRGRNFDAFKIRTMIARADELLERDSELRSAYATSNKLVDDPRITRVGRWLRRLSFDELPQLVNVLRGEMSLVGPRMITPEELPEWGPTAELLLSVRPGLTGLWQVSGRQTLSKADRIRLDGEYVQRMSLGLDLAIIARTVPAVLSSEGAY